MRWQENGIVGCGIQVAIRSIHNANLRDTRTVFGLKIANEKLMLLSFVRRSLTEKELRTEENGYELFQALQNTPARVR